MYNMTFVRGGYLALKNGESIILTTKETGNEKAKKIKKNIDHLGYETILFKDNTYLLQKTPFSELHDDSTDKIIFISKIEPFKSPTKTRRIHGGKRRKTNRRRR